MTRILNAALLVAPIVFFVPGVYAQSPADELEAARKAGREHLQRMAEYLGTTKQVQCTLRSSTEQVTEGMRWEYWTHFDLSLDRPGRLALKRSSGYRSLEFVDDGRMSILIPDGNAPAYVEMASHQAPAETIEEIRLKMPHLEYFPGVTPGVAVVIGQNPGEIVQPLLESARLVGPVEIDGTKTHLVAIEIDPTMTLEVWIAAGDAPYPKQVRTTSVQDFGFGEAMKQIATSTFADWNSAPLFSSDTFSYELGDELTRYESIDAFISEWIGDDMGFDDDGMNDPSSMVGQQAPDFELQTLGGQTFRLSEALTQHKAVVIDFWATWCPPCVAGLPVLTELAATHGDALGFYAINMQEDTETINQFLEKRKLTSMRVLLETDGSVAELFGVSGIPQTVIIGADGIIRTVHVGFSKEMKPQLADDFAAAVEGRPIAGAHSEPFEGEMDAGHE